MKKFKNISIKIASPNKIINWSYGEIKNINFIDYKTLKPEKNGLFCLNIFSIYNSCCSKKKCFCDKNNKFLNLKKSHSSYRFGHIILNYPVIHIWYLKTISNNISHIINLSNKIIDKIINFKLKIIIKSFNKKFKKYSIILFNKKNENFYSLSGVKAIDKLLSDNELLFDCKISKKKIFYCNSINNLFCYLEKINKIYIFYLSGNKPNWFCIKILPVVSPKIRPLIPLNIGKFATSDLNELYKKILIRNIRIKNIKLLGIPKQILINERILLQESVNALFDNEKIENPILTISKRILKSFSNSIKGKYGRFRQNLLGKRVDFSGRTVISVEPKLSLYQCAIPILIAIELFKPFLYFELKKNNSINNIGFIDHFLSNNKKNIICFLKKICNNFSILLNRAPTLHRMGIQSFKILLTQDKTIKLHPLVCLSYNADFDGDQMAIHLPLTINSQFESKYLLLSINNIISPSNGEPIIIPTQDIIMGIYCLTNNFDIFYLKFKKLNNIILFFNKNNNNFLYNIILNNNTFYIKTTIGRIIFFFSLFKIINLKFLNKKIKKKDISYIIKYIYDNYKLELIIKILDKIKKIGFFISTLIGITIGYSDLISITPKYCILKLIKKIKFNNNIFDVINTIEKIFLLLLLKKISSKKNTKINNIYIMLDSGSRGSILQIKQLMIFRGFFSKSNGDIIIEPILDNLKKGLSMKNYFISSFGARKGLTDTSLKTANSGYLTRKLVDVLQDIVIYKIDCYTKIGIVIYIFNYKKILFLYNKIYGRVLFSSIYLNKKKIIKKNTIIDNKIIFLILKKKIKKIFIRSILYCLSSRGVCVFCYGIDLSNSLIVNLGTPIGIIAAQSIGEPGTQLTMRTFHTGGVASYTKKIDLLVNNNYGFVIFKNTKCVLNILNELIILNNFSILIIFNSIYKEIYKMMYGEKILFRNGVYVKKKNKIKYFQNVFYIYSENIGYIIIKENLEKFYFENDKKFYFKTIKKTILIIKNKKNIKKYFIPKNFYIIKNNFSFVFPGDVIAKLSIFVEYKSNIIGGLPRLSELFEARVPKKKAFLSEIDGMVKISINYKDYYIIDITSKYGVIKKYFIENTRKIFINNGDFVKMGDVISDGKPDLNDIIKIIGIEYLSIFFIKEINNIYNPQGIYINEKHLEIVLKQMTKKVRILYSGECYFMQNDILYLEDVLLENVNTLKFSKKVSLYERIVFGITKVSLDSSSFFSAASFQETSKILIDSAIRNRVDYLLGLKENVVIGGIIPAGTGLIEHIFLEKKKTTLQKNFKFFIK